MNDELMIRAATVADFDAWLPLWRGYQAFYKVDLPEATTRTTWRRLLDPAEPMHVALAERAGRIVGIVHFIEHRSCWSERNSVYLQDLFTAPGLRGQGIGRALIEHVYAQAAALGCAKVHWLTHETNAEAMVLYNKVAERPGFVQYRKAIDGPKTPAVCLAGRAGPQAQPLARHDQSAGTVRVRAQPPEGSSALLGRPGEG